MNHFGLNLHLRALWDRIIIEILFVTITSAYINNIWDTFKKVPYLKLLPTTIGRFGRLLIIIMSLQLLFVHLSGIHYFRLIWRDGWRIFQSYCSILLLFLIVKSLVARHRRGSFATQTGFILFYCVLVGYLVKTEQSFDYAVLIDNLAEIFYFESLIVIINGINLIPLWIGLIGVLVIFLLEIKNKSVLQTASIISSWKKIVTILFCYILLMSNLVIQFDEITNFFRSVYTYYRPIQLKKNTFSLDKPYPFLITEAKREALIEDKPHIFLIMLESFNSGFVNRYTEEGKAYTPYFNKLIHEGVYLERFYGNSVQTVKGHFSTLFSLLPLIKGKVYKKYASNRFLSLADCLKRVGYKTVFINGHNRTGFDKTKAMMVNHGYDTYLVGRQLVDQTTDGIQGAWGLPDDLLYRNVFTYLERYASKNRSLFITLTPSFHHVPFSIPKEYRQLYKNPLTLRERYANSVQFVDQGLKVFIEEIEKRQQFENSLIVITADHAYPVGDHYIVFNEIGYYEESFRIPCLLIWKGHLQPKIDSLHTYSQLDIIPTILSAIGAMPERHHFQGQNMLRAHPEKRNVFLIQPYNGTFLASIDYPYKYLKRLRTGEEWLFNLTDDPEENNNLIQDSKLQITLDNLQESMQYIFLNQYLIENNRIYPDDNYIENLK